MDGRLGRYTQKISQAKRIDTYVGTHSKLGYIAV